MNEDEAKKVAAQMTKSFFADGEMRKLIEELCSNAYGAGLYAAGVVSTSLGRDGYAPDRGASGAAQSPGPAEKDGVASDPIGKQIAALWHDRDFRNAVQGQHSLRLRQLESQVNMLLAAGLNAAGRGGAVASQSPGPAGKEAGEMEVRMRYAEFVKLLEQLSAVQEVRKDGDDAAGRGAAVAGQSPVPAAADLL